MPSPTCLVGHPSVVYKARGNGFRTNGNVNHLVLEECEIRDNPRYGLAARRARRRLPQLRTLCHHRQRFGGACVGPASTGSRWVDCTVEATATTICRQPRRSPARPQQRASSARMRSRPARPSRPLHDRRRRSRAWDLGTDRISGPEVNYTYGRRRVPGDRSGVWNDAGRGARAEKAVSRRGRLAHFVLWWFQLALPRTGHCTPSATQPSISA